MVEMVIPMENLADPMDIRFTFKVTNLDDITLYVKSELITPPAGWNGSAEEHGALAAGIDDYFLNDNYTRDKPATDTEENVTIRITYYSDSGYSSALGYEDVTYTITYIDFTDGGYVIVDDDGFETDLESWSLTTEVGIGATLLRSTVVSRTGVASMKLEGVGSEEISYAKKDYTIGAVTSAYIRIWVDFQRYITEGVLEIITDAVEVSEKRTLQIAMDESPLGGTELMSQWLCIGLKLPVNDTYQVRLRFIGESAADNNRIYFDDIRVITKA